MYRRYLIGMAILLFVFMQGCSGESDTETSDPTTGTSTGSVQISLTDAPAFGYDHVWITVRDLWFHKNDAAEPGQNGWIKFPLSSPVTLDLLELGNGNISLPVWEDIELPEGDYTQLRVFLARTEAERTASASAENLSFNNQVDVTDDTAAYPLRVPDAERGIRLIGEFTVKKNEKLKFAVDFDAGHDVVQIEREGKNEYILKPRLAYFDLDNAGAIVGSIDATAAANNPSAHFVIKAEQVGPNGLVHVVRRVTVLADQTGKFVLFPLLPGTYDLVMRGIDYETVILRGVPVTKGTTPASSPTLVPTVTMTPATLPDYALDAAIESPTGAWVDFFQTLPDEAAPYEIRFRHFNPITGQILGFRLSSDPLQVGTYDASNIVLSPVTPVEGNGGYKAVAGAPLHNLDLGSTVVTSATGTLSFGTLTVSPPAAARSVSGSVILPETFAPGTGLDRGVLLASHGGMIVNAIKVDSQMASGGTYTISNLPGGTPEHPLPRALYGIEAFGWSSVNPGNRAIAVPRFADLTTADATGIDLNMVMLP